MKEKQFPLVNDYNKNHQVTLNKGIIGFTICDNSNNARIIVFVTVTSSLIQLSIDTLMSSGFLCFKHDFFDVIRLTRDCFEWFEV